MDHNIKSRCWEFRHLEINNAIALQLQIWQQNLVPFKGIDTQNEIFMHKDCVPCKKNKKTNNMEVKYSQTEQLTYKNVDTSIFT